MHSRCTGHVAGQPETADFEPRFGAAETPSSQRRDFLALRSLSRPTASSRVSSLVRHTEKLRSSRACCTADFLSLGGANAAALFGPCYANSSRCCWVGVGSGLLCSHLKPRVSSQPCQLFPFFLCWALRQLA